MGFLVIPSLLLHAAVLVACIKNAITWALQLVGLAEILEPETSAAFSRQETDCNPSAQDEIIREWLLPVTTFGEFVQRFQGGVADDDVCAVCLSRMEEEDEMRELCNCFHVFHRNCLEKWLHQRQTTCPLCRCCLLPEPEMEKADTMAPQSNQSWLVDSISFLFSQDLAGHTL